MSLRSVLTACVLAGLWTSAFTAPASAAWEGLNYHVSPVGCFPRDSQSASMLKLENGAWAMHESLLGSAYLLCPVNLSGDGTVKIKFAQLWFRLHPALRGDLYINARVMYRVRNSPGAHLAFQLGTDWDYNFGGNYMANDYGFSNKTAEWIDMPKFAHNYFLEVQLRRIRNASFPLAFTGFEFRFDDPMDPKRDPAPFDEPDPVDTDDSPNGLAYP